MSVDRIIVIGAGIAGLSAAYRLKQKGYLVKVLESKASAGGRMAELNEHGMRYNSGARLCYSFYTELQELIIELGLKDAVVRHGSMAITCRSASHQYPLPFKPGLQLLSHPLLPLKEKLALLRLLPDLFYARKNINPGWMASAVDFDDQTLADYIRQKVGPVFLERFIEPIFRGTRSWNPNEVSPALFVSTSAFLSAASYTYSFTDGIGQLTTNLAKQLDIEYEAMVSEIVPEREKNNCLIRYQNKGQEKQIDSAIVVCAIEGKGVSDLITEPVEAEKKFFESIKYNSLGVVHAKVISDEKPDVTFFSGEVCRELSIVEISKDKDISKLYCQLSPELSEKVKNEACTEQLYSVIKESLLALYPALKIDEQTVINQWIENMLPVFYPGYIKKIAEFQLHQEALPHGVYYCGDYLSQALVEGACQSGRHVAETISSHWPIK